MKDSIVFRSGYVAVVGKPNVGKSTLVNAFMGQKIAAVSPRPQTTRRRQLGILTTPNAQVIFVDTPGIHKPVHKLGDFMNSLTAATLEDADIILWIVDLSSPPTPEDSLVAERLAGIRNKAPILLILNKVDLVDFDMLSNHSKAYQELCPGLMQSIPVSATTRYNCKELLDQMTRLLPEGPAFFDAEQITDFYEREIAADLIREAALFHLRDEVPHAIAIRIDEFKERDDGNAFIAATMFVERESHKGIVIGKGGQMLKQIGTSARQEIDSMSGRKVFLELRVKVNKNWRNDPKVLKWLGYSPDSEN